MIFGKDKSCRAGFRDHSRTLNAFWFFAQRECPIHFREFPVSTALPQRFCKNCQTSVLFRLAPINFHLQLHGNAPRTACLKSTTCRCTPMFRAPALTSQDRSALPQGGTYPELGAGTRQILTVD